MADEQTAGQRDKTLNFTDLPLIEVALKRVPKVHFPISLPFVLELKNRLPARFDQMLDLDAAEQPPGALTPVAYAFHVTNGCRLLDSNLGLTVTLQPDLLIVRWAMADDRPYPRFGALRKAANEVIEVIEQISLQPFEAALVNMAYANRVDATVREGRPQPSPWPLSDAWTPDGVREEGQAFESQSVLRGADQIDRRVLVQYRPETADAKPWYLLLTIAGRPVADGESLETAENDVHGALIEWFPRLLSQEAREVYGLKP